MGALMRATDWASTALGPATQWPQSLKTAVSLMLESRFAMVVAWGEDFHFLYNDRYRPILGNKHPAALGARSRDVFPEVWDFIGPLFGKTRQGEAVAMDDLYIPLNRHGYLENCWFTISYSPIRDETGGVGGMLAVVAETTERVEAERRLNTLRELARRATDAKTADEACVNAVSVMVANRADIPFAVLCLFDEAGREARVVASCGIPTGHPAAAPIIGAEEDDPRGWPLQRALREGGSVATADLQERFPALHGAEPEAVHTALLVPLARPGHTRPYGFLIAGVSARRALDERYRSFFELAGEHITTAIVNARTFEEERRRAEALAEIDRAKTEFFSNVSHEFRTPLTLMLGPIEDALADERSSLSPVQRNRIETARRNSLRLLKLVNALLDFSRIEAGRAQASYEPVDLGQLTAELASSFRSACEKAGLNLLLQVRELPQPVYVDRDMWEKIVLNLVSNAFKFTQQGEIEVSVDALGDHARLRVRDTGCGIAAEELPRLFERFHRIAGAPGRTVEGTGIGLALVQELVHLHGGTIRAESTYGKGTTFEVLLPMGAAHLPLERIASAASLASTRVSPQAFVEEALRWMPGDLTDEGTAAGPRARILWADDNADMREYVRSLLASQYEVTTAADGEQALALALELRPDIVLTDIMMPRLDGFGLLRALRSHPDTAATPVIMLSARAGEEARIEGLDAGADDYLVKPFSARELVARVRSQLALSAARQQAQRQREDFSSLFMQASNPFVILRGRDYVIELANPAACRVWNRREEQVLDRPLFEALPELRQQVFKQLLDGVMDTGRPYVGTEMPATLHDEGGNARTVYLNFVYSALRGTSGAIDGVLVTAFDVTEQAVARQRMDELRAQAESANRSKDEFLAMLGHELRNPLSPIVTALQIMRLRGETTREQEILERQVAHLTRLVDDLLDVSRITGGKIELRKRPMELAEAVLQAIEIASPLLEQRRHHVELEVPRQGLPVLADPQRLAQIVSNLLTNSAKYSEPDSRIWVNAGRRADTVWVSVRDEGVGIPPQLVETIFRPFYQQPQNIERSRGGLGLGLAIVRNLVHLHGGQIRVNSPGAGQGSEFTVELPACDASQAPAEQARGAEAGRAAASRRILIVDDNADAAETLARAFRELGHVVELALDGPSALDKAGAFQPDVALIDIGLPVMNGYEVAAHLKRRAASAPRLFAITGYGLETDVRRSSEAGFEAHFVKPVDLDRLARTFLQ